jgi:hypothetical protein
MSVKNNVRKYYHILENISQDYYFSDVFVSVEYTENVDGTMEGILTFPSDLIVSNEGPVGFDIEPKFSTGKEITDLKPTIIQDYADLSAKGGVRKLVVKETIDPFVEKTNEQFKWVGVGFEDVLVSSNNRGRQTFTPNPDKCLDLTDGCVKLNFKKSYHIPTKETILKNSIFNYFKINDFIRIKSYLFGENASTNLGKNKPYYLIRDFYVTSVGLNANLIEVRVKTHQSQLDKIPASISTKQKKSIWDFCMSYLFPTILNKTAIRMIIVSKIDYDTMKKSNIGLYRQNINTFGFFLAKMMQDYNLQFVWSGIPNVCVMSYGNTYLPALNFMISLGKATNSIYTEIDAWRAFTDYTVSRVYDDSNPVVVRMTSVAAQLGSIKKGETAKPKQKIYGDEEAISKQTGTIINMTTNIALDEDALLEQAKKIYSRTKYLGQKNTFIMKEPGSIKTIIRFTDDKIYNNGFYYITNTIHRFTIESGYEFEFGTGIRFPDTSGGLGNLVEIVDI